jgi:hypothetical protein
VGDYNRGGVARHQLLFVSGLFCGCCALVVLYCAKVDRKRLMTKKFVRWLRQMGLNGLAASLLEAAGPLASVGAQVTYMIEPLIGTRDSQISELARTLEDPEGVLQLIEALRSEEGDP